ncbi:MAG: regulatory protein RecX [Deltaproteobacteria bacterium]|nr:regulatory protein RecX [Deltaproteobacteria bacterium]NCP02197.1 regulatory protein RecX [Deltaproteobacteria bacterium]NCP78305.1 regulatory protein RecX [Desulfuromonadales bacterium]
MTTSKSSDSDAFTCALRILGRREHSTSELRSKLVRLGFSAPEIEAVLARCREYNYLDDRRYALARCHELLRSGRGIGLRLRLDLRQHGISESLIDEVLETINREIEPLDVLRQQLERRFAGFDYAAASEKERRRIVHHFLRRGFSLSQIFALLKHTP